jgi:hypothetical protein
MNVQNINNLNEKIKLPHWTYWVWLISIVSLGLSLTSIFWGYNIKWNVEIVSTALMLGFVGVLATVVVVSNYNQVRDIQKDFLGKLENHKKDTESTIYALSKKFELLAVSSSKNIDTSTYQILGVKHNDVVENWYILIQGIPIEEKTLKVFTKQFRDEFCKKPGNINLIDNYSIYPLITEYPLEGDKYIFVADHFVAMIIFDTDDMRCWNVFCLRTAVSGADLE